MFYALFYEYVEDIMERRQPFRADHLSAAGESRARGELLMAGAWTEPVDGAMFVFRTNDRGVVERFVEGDPYIQNGLVTSWRIREWNVVVGADIA